MWEHFEKKVALNGQMKVDFLWVIKHLIKVDKRVPLEYCMFAIPHESQEMVEAGGRQCNRWRNFFPSPIFLEHLLEAPLFAPLSTQYYYMNLRSIILIFVLGEHIIIWIVGNYLLPFISWPMIKTYSCSTSSSRSWSSNTSTSSSSRCRIVDGKI